MSEEWAPFGLSEDETERYGVLVDGVPKRLREPLIAWLKRPLASSDYPYSVQNAATRHIEMVTDIAIGVPGDSHIGWESYATILRKVSELELLRIIDAVLAAGWYGTRTGALDQLLTTGRSRWQVGERMGKPGLVAREPEGVQDIIEGTFTTSGAAGLILARAWAKVHGLTPDDPGAYADAVRAVETAAHKHIEPSNADATLGSMAAAIRNQGGWRLPLREHKHAPAGEVLVAMMRTLYRGHVDRHGNDDYRDVTHEEAHAGVVLAATLVSWFASGAAHRTTG